ncbi:hypothetical protein B0H10DRAFT_2212688 [Mycena sp. CBHHK59/15]|nr:hypothetical protein B0H10DRAFT_2212688 [Mycena sp. CBHHK59/15]
MPMLFIPDDVATSLLAALDSAATTQLPISFGQLRTHLSSAMQGPSSRRILSQQQPPSSRVPGSPAPRVTDSPGPSPLPERIPNPGPRPQDTSVDSDDNDADMQDLSRVADTSRKRLAASFEEDEDDHQPVQRTPVDVPLLEVQGVEVAPLLVVLLLIFGQMIASGRELVPDKGWTLI